MTTATSYSNHKRCLNFYGSLLRRGRGLMLLVLMLEFIFGPVQYWIHISDTSIEEVSWRVISFNGQSQLHTAVMAVCLTGILLAAPLVVGLIQMSYMHSKKAADVYHSLPVTRPQLLLTNLASAFTIVMAPTLVNYLIMGITAAVSGKRGAVFDPVGILAELACWAVYTVVVLAVIAFVAVQVGTIFDNLVFSGELLAAPAFLVLCALGVFTMTLAGFNMDHVNPYVLASLSPFSLMVLRMAMPWAQLKAGNTDYYYMSQSESFGIANLAVVIWLVLAAAAIAAACWLYSRRKSEMAEQSTSRGPLALVGKGMFMLLCGPMGATLLCGILGLRSRATYLVWTVVLAALAYVIAEVVLLRGFRGFKRSLLSGTVLLAVAVAFGVIVVTGGLGYQSRVPQASQVESVTIDYRGRYDLSQIDASTKRVNEMDEARREELIQEGRYQPYIYSYVRDVTLTQPESIEAASEIHRMVLRQQGAERETWDVNSSTGGTKYGRISYEITYQLKNGKTLRRYYYGIPDDSADALARMEDLEEFKTKTHSIFTAEVQEFASVTVSGMEGTEMITDQATIARLIDAMAADYREETMDSILKGEQKDRAYISFQYKKDVYGQDLNADTFTQCWMVVTSDWTRTLDVLEDAGLGELVSRGGDEAVRAVVISDGRFYSGDPVQISMNEVPQGMDLDTYLEEYYGFSSQQELEEFPYLYFTQDQSLIRQMEAQGNIQHMGQQYMSLLVLADEDGKILSAWQIPYDKLPREVYESIPEGTRMDYEANRSLGVSGEMSEGYVLTAGAAQAEPQMPVPVSSPEEAIQVVD